MLANLFNTGVKIKQAGQSAGGNVADVAGKVNSMVKNRWALFQEKRQSKQEWAPPKETVQERLISAAASTTVLLRKGLNETKEKVVVGKVKVEEVIMDCIKDYHCLQQHKHDYIFSFFVFRQQKKR